LGLNSDPQPFLAFYFVDEISTDQPLVPIVTLVAKFNRWKRAIFIQLIRGLSFWAGDNVAL
jgi:hypothetical protein